jgi:RNA polymerase sigma-70 factor (ECF subfamily)
MIEKIISGDIQAFEVLFNDNYERLAYYAYQYLKDQDNAEDVVQELFSKLWINRKKLGSDINITAYLYSAVRNACLNHIKHEKVKESFQLNSIIPLPNDNYISNKIDADELNKLIQSSIFELPPERQKIFLLSREQGMKYQEIAEHLAISVKTVEAQMGSALRFLRERLKEYLLVFIAFLSYFLNQM